MHSRFIFRTVYAILLMMLMVGPGVEAQEEMTGSAQPDSISDTATVSRAGEGTHGSVTLGLGVMLINNDSYEFGKLTGLTGDTPFAIGAADIRSANGKRYLDFKIDNAGLDNKRLDLKGGKTGKYKFHFDYFEQDNLLSNNSKTPFNGAGGTVLTLPVGFDYGPTTSTANMTNLAANLKNVDLGTKRKDGEAGVDLQLNQNVGMSFNFRRYLKDGAKSMGAPVGSAGGGPSVVKSVVLPEPVDYQTNEIRAGLNWRGDRGQTNLDYYYSTFTSSNKTVTWEDPYFGGIYPFSARNSLPPDNQVYRLSLNGSYKLAGTTRLSARVERGSMTQDEAFLPYSINAAAALPRSSANARIDTTLAKVDLTTQPLPKLSVHAGFRHYATDNKTPVDLFQRVINDGTTQVAANSAEAQYNRPFDYSQNQYTLDGVYFFGQGMTLKLGLDHDQKDYDLRAVNATKEDTVLAKLNKRWEDGTTAYIDWAQSRRRSDGYDPLREFEEAHTPQYLATVAANVYFDNLPGMRQFDIADRDRSRQGIGVVLLPLPNLTVGLNINRNRDKYDASTFGLQSRETKNGMLDATLTPDRITSISLYYQRQEFDSRLASREYSGGGVKAAQAIDSTRDWWVRTQDNLDTVGASAKRSFMDEKLLMRLAYTFARTSTDYSFTQGSSLPQDIALPTLLGRRQTLDVSGTYKVERDMDIQLGMMVELYKSNDFAIAGFGPGEGVVNPAVLTLSGTPAPYRAFIVQSSLKYRF